MNLNETWEHAWAKYQNKEFQAALKLLKHIDEKHDDPTVSFVMAQSMWQLGRYQHAIKYFKKSFELDKNQLQYPLALIKSYISEYQKKKALDIVNQSLDLFESHQELRLYKALLSHKNIDKININDLIDSFNNNQANQNVINICMASKIFKRNNYSKISIDVFNTHKYSAASDCYLQIFKLNPSLKLLSFPKDVLKYALKQSKIKGHVIEAGVYFGQSINFIAKTDLNKKVIGFDSFEGLPEDWSSSEKLGSYSTQGELPTVFSNVKLIKGWFKDSMPKFINENPAPIRFLHIDCDIYSSTKDILESLSAFIVVGTVIVFDDFFGYEGYQEHEWKAFNEFIIKYKLNIKYLAFCPLGRELAIKVID